MDYAVIYLQQLLLLLMFILSFRSVLKARQSELLTGIVFLAGSLVLFLLRILLSALPALLATSIAAIFMVSVLFAGSVMQKLKYGLLFLAVWIFLFLVCGQILENNGILISPFAWFNEFLAILFAQLITYVLVFILNMVLHPRRYPLAFYLALIPVGISMPLFFFWDEMVETAAIANFIPYLFLLLMVFDYICLALESWIVIFLNTRQRLAREEIHRQHLMERYQLLKQQYENSFDFLHGLLRNCSDLSLSIETGSLEGIEKQTRSIADEAFARFNAICISSPALSTVLKEHQKQITEQSVMVSTMLRSDHFGLLTLDEQKQLFSLLMDFCLDQIGNSSAPVKTLAIKSTQVLSDILMVWIFPDDGDVSDTDAFKTLRKQLSSLFSAGIQIDRDDLSKKSRLSVVLPMISAVAIEESGLFDEPL